MTRAWWLDPDAYPVGSSEPAWNRFLGELDVATLGSGGWLSAVVEASRALPHADYDEWLDGVERIHNDDPEEDGLCALPSLLWVDVLERLAVPPPHRPRLLPPGGIPVERGAEPLGVSLESGDAAGDEEYWGLCPAGIRYDDELWAFGWVRLEREAPLGGRTPRGAWRWDPDGERWVSNLDRAQRSVIDGPIASALRRGPGWLLRVLTEELEGMSRGTCINAEAWTLLWGIWFLPVLGRAACDALPGDDPRSPSERWLQWALLPPRARRLLHMLLHGPDAFLLPRLANLVERLGEDKTWKPASWGRKRVARELAMACDSESAPKWGRPNAWKRTRSPGVEHVRSLPETKAREWLERLRNGVLADGRGAGGHRVNMAGALGDSLSTARYRPKNKRNERILREAILAAWAR